MHIVVGKKQGALMLFELASNGCVRKIGGVQHGVT